ncbi:hypothetical protein SADUNF_Sadunf19G0032400 [Salix dunnii]|uniref:Glutaredoxin-dependent peroxiredoxin n=1 Tax=Salix dunnii TaxID=1413687 RepID=A0A835J1R0_9ROSI|nr:hypothetical protein SADUNF_Sadunf19G0032400 [Salix dunnii]
MASAILKRTSPTCLLKSMTASLGIIGGSWRSYAKVAVGTDIVSAAPGVSLQKSRTWDEGVSSKFSTTPLKDIFKGKKVVIFGLPGAYTGVCSQQHVPSYKNIIDKLKAKGIDSVICVAVNDPYTMHAWAEKLQAKDAIEFYGDYDGSLHKSLELDKDLSVALLGHRSERYDAVMSVLGVLTCISQHSELSDSGVSFDFPIWLWSAYVEDGEVKVLNVEEAPSDFKVSGGEVILGQI